MIWICWQKEALAFVDESIVWMVFNVLHLQSAAKAHMKFYNDDSRSIQS